jgi:hypothetical protein
MCNGSSNPRQSAFGLAETTFEELLADPIMALLWRRDGLEPAQARGIIMELRERVRRTRSLGGMTRQAGIDHGRVRV